MNNDAYFDDDGSSILALYEALEEDPYVSAAGPIVRNLDNTIQSASYSHTMWFPYAFAKKSVPVQNKRINRGFLSGSCVMLRVSSFLEIHGLDPDFFLYGDDVDLAIRERRKGWKLVLVPKATVYHKRAAASKIYSHQYIYTALRGTLILINKQAQWYQKPTAFLTAAVISVALFFVSCARGRFGAAEPIVRAWRDYKRGYWSGLDGAPLTNVNRPTVRDAHVSEI